jgi:cytochrome c-type biogenesis protein
MSFALVIQLPYTDGRSINRVWRLDISFAYVAGLLTLINPCVLPVIPIALASSAGHRLGPAALATGMSLTFSTFGVLITAIGPAIGLSADRFSQIGALMMVLFGLVLLVPRLNSAFATATSGFAANADGQMHAIDNDGLTGHFLGGMLLGAVWSPCIGPTLGGAISLASQGTSLLWAAAIMLAFSLGISTIILGLAYGTREAIRSRQQSLRRIAERSKPIMGVAFTVVGAMIFFKLNQRLEGAILDAMPIWLQNLSVVL